MRLVFIGCVEFSYVTLKHLLTHKKDVELVGVVTRKKSPSNADFHSLEELARQADIPCFFDEGNNQEKLAIWLRSISPDVAYCFGWPFLIKKEVLQIPRLGVIGYHPTMLPKNRGRHPIIWALALGLSQTASTFFIMDEGMDSGDIISQESLGIGFHDDASTLYSRLTAMALRQIDVFTPQLGDGKIKRIPQNNDLANFWRRRSKKDGEIDWRMPSIAVYNLVRSLTHPYVGAHCIFKKQEVRVWKSEIADAAYEDLDHHEPGKVLNNSSDGIVIKCGKGALK